MNEECKNTLLILHNNILLSGMIVNNFSHISSPLLKAFIKVRIEEESSSLKNADAPKKNGKL